MRVLARLLRTPRVFRTPWWGKTLSVLGALLFTALATSVLTWALSAPLEGRMDLMTRGAGLAIAMWMIYMAYLGLLLVRHGWDTITLEDDGLTVVSRGRAVRVLWSEPIRVLRSDAYQVLELRAADGQRLTIVDYWIPDFATLSAVVEQRWGHSSDGPG